MTRPVRIASAAACACTGTLAAVALSLSDALAESGRIALSDSAQHGGMVLTLLALALGALTIYGRDNR